MAACASAAVSNCLQRWHRDSSKSLDGACPLHARMSGIEASLSVRCQHALKDQTSLMRMHSNLAVQSACPLLKPCNSVGCKHDHAVHQVSLLLQSS